MELSCIFYVKYGIIDVNMINYNNKEKRDFMRFNRRRRYTYYSSYSNSRRSRVRWDRVGLIVGAVVLVLGIAVWLNFSRIQLLFKGYSFSQQNTILALENKAVDEVLTHDKMEHIKEWISGSESYQLYDDYEKYLSLHKDLKVEDVVTTVNDIMTNYKPKLDALTYNEDQLWNILKVANIKDLQYIIDHQYTYGQIQPYMNIQGFAIQDVDKYIELYNEKKNYNYAVLATAYPFIISKNDNGASYTIQNSENVMTLVKKGFQYPSSYVPDDLVTPASIPVSPDCENPQLRQEAAEALTQMYNDAKQEGYTLIINSAYRSYKEQEAVYKEIHDRYDEVTASSLVAIPGASEHQSGLGVDLTSQSVLDDKRNGISSRFGDKPEYKWCIANSYKYGFILRFEEDKADITGIGNEPWHFRYVGKEVAKEIFQNGWTLEEYCLYKGAIPKIKENK